MNPEQRFVGHGIKVTVELLVIFIFQFAGFQRPQRVGVIDDIILGSFNLLAVFPLFLLAECNRDGEEAAILLQQRGDACFFKELLAVIVYVKNDIRTTFCLISVFNRKLRTAIAGPLYSLGTFPIGFSDDFDFLGNHKSRIEPQSKMTDDGISIVFIFLKEVIGARESYLVNILVYFFSRKPDTMVGHCNGIFSQRNMYG